MSLLGKIDTEVAAVGSIAFTVIILIIIFAKMKETSSIVSLNNTDINTTISETITALKTPADYFDLILVIVILVGLYMFVRKSSLGGTSD